MKEKLAPWLTIAALLLVAYVSYTMRVGMPAYNADSANSAQWHSLDSDGLYHMRRLSEYRKADGMPSARDDFLNYPHGAIIPWPPYYTMVADVLVGDNDDDIEMQMGSLALYFSVLTSILVALAAWMVMGRGAALVAGLLHAFHYGSMHYGSIGVADHHALVSLLNCFILCGFSFPSRFGGFSSLRFCILSAVASGAAAGLMLGVWVGALMYLLPLQLLCLWWLYNYFNRQVALFVSLFHLAALIVLLPAILQSPWIEDYPWMVINLSYFHLLWLALGVLLPLPLWGSRSQKASRKYMHYVLTSGAVFVAVIFAFGLPLASGILEGFAWVSRVDEFMSGIAESAPLIGNGATQSTGFGVWIGWSVLVLPFSYWLAWRKNKFATPVLLPWLIALVPLLLQACAQRRFADALAAPLAVVVAVSVCYLLSKTKATWPVQVALAACFIVAAQFQGVKYSIEAYQNHGYDEVTGAEHDLFEWIGRQKPAERSVLAAWDFGHTIEWVAKRPSIATNFGSYIGRDSFIDPARFFMTDDLAAAENILQERKVQYVVVTSRLPDLLASHAQRIGADVKDYRSVVKGAGVRLLPKWFQTMAAQVYNFGDADGAHGPASSIAFLRLVYLSPTIVAVGEQLGGQTSVGRIWEYVAGANVVGSTLPNSAVDFTVDFVFLVNGEQFVANQQWTAHAFSDDSGQFSARIPYCSGENGEAMVTEIRCRTPEGVHIFELDETQVLHGETVRLK
ncbi:MAG TPA: hypothetical protein EYN86_00060 [Planctomycetes bacterium]|nr:hypothetical protein [Planctomycetota bacterium]